MSMVVRLAGRELYLLNSPGYAAKFTPALSLFLTCDTQAEIDGYWQKLSRGGTKGVCGWLTDKYGVAWQVVPTILERMLHGKDQQKTSATMAAMMKMTKLNIAQLEAAHARG